MADTQFDCVVSRPGITGALRAKGIKIPRGSTEWQSVQDGETIGRVADCIRLHESLRPTAGRSCWDIRRWSWVTITAERASFRGGHRVVRLPGPLHSPPSERGGLRIRTIPRQPSLLRVVGMTVTAAINGHDLNNVTSSEQRMRHAPAHCASGVWVRRVLCCRPYGTPIASSSSTMA